MTKTVTRSITLPASVFFKNVGGEAINLPWADVPESILGEIAVRAGMVVLNNSFNSGGKDVKETDRLAKAMKRWDAWTKGSYEIVERATAQATLMRECYVGDMIEKHPGMSADAIEKRMKSTVKQVLGDDTNATFDNFLKAISKEKPEGTYEKLVAKYEKAAAELEATRNAAAASIDIDLSDIDLD